MEYLSMIIGQGLVHMDPAKLSAIKDWQPPSSVKGVCSFLRFANFYQKFIPNFSNIVAPIVLLTRKDHPWSWTEPQQTAFNTLKSIFSSTPILCIPDVSRPFSLMTNTSLLAAGAVLMQSDMAGDLHPCAYFSKTFSLAERNYDIYDWELLAVILTLVEWKQYLQGTSHPVSILTDHKNLSYLKDPHKLSRWKARWSLFLQDFDIVWKVTPGTHMGPADGIILTPQRTMLILPSFLTPWSSTPLTSHWPTKSNPPLPLTPLCSGHLQHWPMALPCSCAPLSRTGPSIMGISISAIECSYPPRPVPPYFTRSTPPLFQDIWESFIPRLSWSRISGGWDSPPL